MSHRSYLFSLRLGYALREVLAEGYSLNKLSKDVLAGVTVGIIAIPLAMALAIASGVAPQYGLYTAIIAGFIIALTGGSRFSISGPTAAFVVILYPVAIQYGLSGLLIATVLSGLILLLMAAMRLGRLIEYIPEAVTLGFTAGIAVVIATLQFQDFFGLPGGKLPEYYLEKVVLLVQQLPQATWPSVLIATVTLIVMLLWPRFKTVIPAHLPALFVGTLLAILLLQAGVAADTIGSRFSYTLADGSVGNGIPPYLPYFDWPWLRPGPGGEQQGFSWPLLKDLLAAAFAMAMLCAIESLLCAVVLDGMSGRRHSANSELLGQGLGNIITPFFGGITATAALARSAANFKAGAQSPLAAVVHSLVILLALLLLAPLLSFVPMAALSALLLMVAWNMSEAPKALHLLKTAPRSDILVFLCCFSLTVLLDMVIAITVGMLLAAVLFVKDIAEMTKVTDVSLHKKLVDTALPAGWKVLKINGPLFFAAAERVFADIASLTGQCRGIVLYMDGVTVLDAGGLAALNKLISQSAKSGTELIITDLQFQPLRTMARAGVKPVAGSLSFYPGLKQALDALASAAATRLADN
ncbi:C4-dicarboxylic acid transporter DauA [Arsukibacterium indicum]|uniref:C4-dicarboxylic acid transporter DauA n=1 Tax=Arsukibacterium indicum TaxID=2848612 RepID=A0ABS6MLW6_9GAMM|nr:C4-dicarboxylic acid transporter DauA [Arsukibacterium indicum]MBV2129296.1 C4-dicarboxylic acid transporter DauA [Arsukibacterium indicum]